MDYEDEAKELQLARQKLERSRKQLDAIIQSAMDAIITTDGELHVLVFNKAAEKMFRCPAEEALGKPLERFIPQRFREVHSEQMRGFAATGMTTRSMGNLGAIWGLRKGGEEFPVEAAISHVESGGEAFFTVILRDITERLRQDEELRRSNAELEQFAYVASHDLQEPLRMVVSYTELLAERYRGKLDANADKYIGYAVDGARRMQRLIEDLLSYARVSSHAKPLKPTDASAIVASVIKMMSTAIENGNAEIVCHQLPAVLADEGQLGQVFQNLIGNALKFRRGVPPRVEISAEPFDDAWRFSVTDNGIGMEKDSSARIFQMFQRLHTREEYEGTGIGLAISKRIVERHGGKIWFESTPGQGTTFYFTMPNAEKG